MGDAAEMHPRRRELLCDRRGVLDCRCGWFLRRQPAGSLVLAWRLSWGLPWADADGRARSGPERQRLYRSRLLGALHAMAAVCSLFANVSITRNRCAA